jgi:hypothetical protein
MKKSQKILLAAAMAALFTGVNSSFGDEPLLSPRARQNQIPRTTGVDTGPDLTQTRPTLGNARAAELFPRQVKGTSGSSESVDLAHRNQPFYPGKNPIWENRSSQEFQVAPMVHGKMCEPDGSKGCCKK